MKDLRNGKTLIIFSQDLMAIGNGFMKSRSPWVNLFHSPARSGKRKKQKITGKSGNTVQILQK